MKISTHNKWLHHNWKEVCKEKVGRGWFRLRSVETALAMAGGTVLLALMLLVCSDIFMRFFLNAPIQWAFGLAELMMVLVFLGFAYTQREQGFLRIELFTSHLPRTLRERLQYVDYIAAIVFFGILAWKSIVVGWDSFVRHETTRGLEALVIWPARTVIVLGVILLLIELIAGLLRHRMRKACHQK